MSRAVRKTPTHPGKNMQCFGDVGEHDHGYEASAGEQEEIAKTHY
jgi:hypothetical protein